MDDAETYTFLNAFNREHFEFDLTQELFKDTIGL